MCDAAWCAPCTWAPLRWAVRYDKCSTFTFTGGVVWREPECTQQNGDRGWHWQWWRHAQTEHLKGAVYLPGKDPPVHPPNSRTYSLLCCCYHWISVYEVCSHAFSSHFCPFTLLFPARVPYCSDIFIAVLTDWRRCIGYLSELCVPAAQRQSRYHLQSSFSNHLSIPIVETAAHAARFLCLE